MFSLFRVSIISFTLIIIIALSGCEDTGDVSKRFPQTLEEKQISFENAKRIGDSCTKIIRNSIDDAIVSNVLINPYDIAQRIEQIDGVLSAEPTPSGTAIVIRQDDSTSLNALLVTKDNEKLFHFKNGKFPVQNRLETKNAGEISYYPYGSRKALILAPFQNDFQTDLLTISQYLQSLGYKVYSKLNESADLNSFRGDTLIKYDVVYIDTHGAADAETYDRTITTGLATGESTDFMRIAKTDLTIEEQNALFHNVSVSNRVVIGVSVQWINITTHSRFKDSWIFVNACESSKIDEGPASLSEAFLELGAGGYNGFDVSIPISAGGATAVVMMGKFTSGLTFKDASREVRRDPLLLSVTWAPAIIPLIGIVYDFSIYDFDDIQINTEPFYLCKSYLGSINNSTWDVTIYFNSTYTWHADVTFYSDGTTRYDEPAVPGEYLSFGEWSIKCDKINWDIGSKLSYVFDGIVSGDNMTGTFTYGNEIKQWSAKRK